MWRKLVANENLDVVHCGLDRRTNWDVANEEGAKRSFYSLEDGIQQELQFLKENLDKDKRLIVIFDCKVFSCDYFHGADMPFPFSYSKIDLTKLLKFLKQYKISFL